MSYQNIREEELKNKIAQDYFPDFDCTKIVGNIDFCVTISNNSIALTPPLGVGGLELESLLWAEAKKGKSNIHHSLVQLILTIGKARTFDKSLPPAYLGAFDAEKIAFIHYNDIHDIFYINDFNWNVTPSNYETKEFKLLLDKVTQTIDKNSLLYFFDNDHKEIKTFINDNFIAGKSGTSKIKIDKNNFMVIYNKWLQVVKPTIEIDWDIVKKINIIDGDFYLADLLSAENESLKDSLFVLLKTTHYELDKTIDASKLFTSKTAKFNDKQKAHTQFWNRYDRPPKEEYWDYIVERRDLLVPQDVRERKGSFFTPQIWVELSQKYLTDVLGTDWQDDYYIWDCAAGTGNLLAGLTNKYHIYASTLDRQDIDVIHDRIKNGANLLEKQCFQFDFLNDDFTKLPQSLQNIINDPEKRKKLVMYINPPYAEATSAKTVTGTGKNKAGVAKDSNLREIYRAKINGASNEIFALFMARIYDKIPNVKLAQFSTLKFVSGTNFIKFRDFFLAKFLGGFVVRADSFDNVKGAFPIGFTMWDLNVKENIKEIKCEIFGNNDTTQTGIKHFYGDLPQSINKWIKLYDNGSSEHLAYMGNPSPDFQHNNQMYLSLEKGIEHFNFWAYTKNNIFYGCTYFTVRQVIEPTWLNDRDQFLFPNDGWQTDGIFQNDCLAYTLFHSQNKITSKDGVNHFIPFTEQEINAQEKMESNFMTQFIKGKIKQEKNNLLFAENEVQRTELVFSDEAKAVFDAGRELWKYYHKEPNCNVNASLYDIREHFQGRNATGKMNNKSTNEEYSLLIASLRNSLKVLAKKIEPKVYEYGFLKA